MTTLSAALECNGIPSSYFPVSTPHASGDQVIVPIPIDNLFNCQSYFYCSNLFYDIFPVNKLRPYHVEKNYIQLVHISVGLN